MDTQNMKKVPCGRYPSTAKTRKRGSSFSSFFYEQNERGTQTPLSKTIVQWTLIGQCLFHINQKVDTVVRFFRRSMRGRFLIKPVNT